MAHDAPTLRGYTFSKPPDRYEVWWDRVVEKHRLSDGATRQYYKGYKLRFRFQWSKNWLNEDDYSNLVVIYNDESALALIPRPNTYPSTQYTVILTNDFDAKPWKDFLEVSGMQGFEGKIEGESYSVVATATGWA